MAVLEVLFGRGGQHDNDPDKVRCTGQMLWNLANLGPSQYTTFTAMINADEHRETVSSVANKLRDFHSRMNGAVQAHISAVVKNCVQAGIREEMKEVRGMRGEISEIREEMKKINAAPVRASYPKLQPNAPS